MNKSRLLALRIPPTFTPTTAPWSSRRGPPELPGFRAGSANLAQIAEELGYESAAGLGKAFQRVVGVSPGAYRRTSRSTPEHPAI